MPTNHPHHYRSAEQPNIFGVLAVCALIFGTAILVVDLRSGADTNRTLLLVVGLVSLTGALALGVAASITHRREGGPRSS